MTHAYHQPISVTLTDGAPATPATPATICWRGIAYHVLEVFETWHLMDRWWERERERPEGPGAPGSSTQGPSDRTYYRLRCASVHDELICEVYFDAAGDLWVLERVYD